MSDPVSPVAGSEWQIVGLGSYLNSDDEIGLVLVQALSLEEDWSSRCVVWESADAATIASSLIEWRKPVVLVDAADMGILPGESRFFADRDASVILKDSLVSTHGIGLAEALQLARVLDFDQPVRVFGIQPFDLSPKHGLTPEMTSRLPALLCTLKAACLQLR